jgi:hypothetical protein
MMLATSSLVLREPTPQEREERRAYLWQRNGMDAWQTRINAMSDPDARAGELAKWELNRQSLEREVARNGSPPTASSPPRSWRSARQTRQSWRRRWPKRKCAGSSALSWCGKPPRR